jgi:glucose/arabinose dehydrogenase
MQRSLLLVLLTATAYAQRESDHYTLENYHLPDGCVLEVGGMDFLSDGRLVVSTRRGQVWLVENALADDVDDARYSLFAEGLREGLGLNVVDDEIFVVQRGELSKLVDTDGDGTCDRVDTITNDWGLSGNYHEFAFGLPTDDAGNFYVTLNVGFWSPEWWHGKAQVPYRGWALRIAPDGAVRPIACGFRSPCGVGRNAAGDLFVTDNQGDWCASSPIYHLTEGAFYGHPASLEWTPEYLEARASASDQVPPAAAARRKPPAAWIPYKWSRSTGNLAHDPSGGAFGPFAGQLFVAELTNGMVLRAPLEKVRGEYQGAVLPFRTRLGSTARIAFAPDGSLMLGYTNRGWGGRGPADGLARLRWTGVAPLEMHTVHLRQDGFEITFTEPLADVAPGDVRATQYDYNYWWEYGSPPQHVAPLEVVSTQLSDDRRTLTLRTAGLTPAMVVEVVLAGVKGVSGRALLHDEFAYTINQLPEGPPTTELVAKVVPPPPSKGDRDQGWLRISYGDATDGWIFDGWTLCEADLDPDDATRFRTRAGDGALVNDGAQPSDYTSKTVFGDQQIELEVMLPEEGGSALFVQGRYGVSLAPAAIGAVLGDGRGFAGAPPARDAFQGAGVWQKLEIDFRAPRFAASGAKLEDAVLRRVALNEQVVQENVVLPARSAGALLPGESPRGPLVLAGGRGAVAFRGIKVRPLYDPPARKGWTEVFAADEIDAWLVTDDAEWELTDDDTLVGSGGRGHLFSPRGDYRDFELRGRFRIGEGGNSGLYFRATHEPGWPSGYEAQINSDYPDPQKTGSLYGIAPIKTHLVPAGTWFDYHVLCRDEQGGTRVVISVNETVVVDVLDERRHGPGHVAVQQHHVGSRIEFERLEIRELR